MRRYAVRDDYDCYDAYSISVFFKKIRPIYTARPLVPCSFEKITLLMTDTADFPHNPL